MSKKQKRILWPLITLVVLALTTVALIVRRDVRGASAKPEAAAALTPNGSQARSNESAEVEQIDLRLSGFEPSEITRPSGRFLLGVNNRTGLTELSLTLVHESGRSAVSKRLSRVKTWREVLDLHPGRYVLREATHRDWLCRITITER
ncbi:MAG: hypothetical protein QOG23_4338 [Blastocatellia bacterium]|jgi:hypothetical protein|nr:hypothetical protein [Blastocatellia bacterium]